MGKTSALILAAGQGTRFGGDTPKQFLKLQGKALWERSLEAFLPFSDVTVLVTDESHVKMIREALPKYSGGMPKDKTPEIFVTAGGACRAESVLKGLRFLGTLSEKPDTVLVHDAARCLVTPEVILACLEETGHSGAAIAAVPATDTIKSAASSEEGALPAILSTPDRRMLYQAQTPQGFSFELILSAYEKAYAHGALGELTDDASAVERFTSHRVFLTPGSPENIKVTRPLDLAFAESILRFRILHEKTLGEA